MNCPRCGRENPPENEFCGRCGSELAEPKQQPISDEETLFCYRHKKVPTVLRCGRCEQPICTKCTIIGPAGPRCPDCAKQNIAFRPGAIAYSAKVGARRIASLGPWGIYVLILLGGMLFGFMRGCMPSTNDPGFSESQYSAPDE